MKKPVKTRRQKLAMWLAIGLAVLLLVPILAGVILSMLPSAEAVTQSEISRLKDNQKALESEKKRIQDQLNALKSEKADAIAQKQAIDLQIDVTAMEIENTTALIQELTQAIFDQQVALGRAVSEGDEAYELFRTRVRVMEEAGSATYLGILFQSSSFSDLLGRWEFINEVIASDQRLMSDLAEKRAAIDEARLQLEADKADQMENRRQLDVRQAELAEQYRQADAFIAQLVNEHAEYEKAYNDQVKAMEDASKDIAKAEAEFKRQQQAAKKSTKYVGGVYTWPLPSSYNITSPFGWRDHPILKVPKMHTGIDIGAPKNSQIVAANAGTVIVATYNSGYGNYIVIDHGGGQSTLYAHQTKFASGVKVGTEVKKGQLIGYVGSTGLSTGPHLHFEVRINGEHQNPEKYFTKAG